MLALLALAVGVELVGIRHRLTRAAVGQVNFWNMVCPCATSFSAC